MFTRHFTTFSDAIQWLIGRKKLRESEYCRRIVSITQFCSTLIHTITITRWTVQQTRRLDACSSLTEMYIKSGDISTPIRKIEISESI